MPRGVYHWPPRRKERVYLYTREEEGLVSVGDIIGIDRDPDDSSSNEVHVLFHMPDRKIHQGAGSYELAYDGTTCYYCLPDGIKVEGLYELYDPSKWKYIWIGPEIIVEGSSELLTFRQDDFEGNWNSNQQRWELD